MSEKVIAIMDKPANCQACVFGVCKYSLPLTTRRKGYYCQLKEPKDRAVEDFDYNEEIHLSNCPLKPHKAEQIAELSAPQVLGCAEWRFAAPRVPITP